MKKIFLLIAACFALTAPLAAQPCKNGVYVSGFGGANFKNDNKVWGDKIDWNTGYAAGGAVGYKYNSFRTELEGSWRQNRSKKADGDVHFKKNTGAAMVNGYYDLDMLNLPLGMTPYVGAGVGVAYNKIDGRHETAKATGDSFKFAYQGIAGVSIPVSERVDLTTEYRYFNGGCNNDHNHTVAAGLRLWF